MKVMYLLASSTQKLEKRDWGCKELWPVFCDGSDTRSRLAVGRLWHIGFLQQLHTRLRAAAADGGNFSVKSWEGLDPEWHLEAQVQPSLVPREALHQKWFRTHWRQDHRGSLVDQRRAPAPAPLSLAPLPSPVRTPVLGEGRTIQNSAPAAWVPVCPQQSGAGRWAEEKPRFTHGSDSSPSISSPTFYQSYSCQHTLDRSDSCSHQILLSHQSHWAHTARTGMLPTRAPLQEINWYLYHLIS